MWLCGEVESCLGPGVVGRADVGVGGLERVSGENRAAMMTRRSLAAMSANASPALVYQGAVASESG